MMDNKYSFLGERGKLIDASEMPAIRWIQNEREAVREYVEGSPPGFVCLLMKGYGTLLDEIIRNGTSYSEHTSVDLLRVIDKVNKQRGHRMAIVRNTPIKADVVRKAKKLSSTERIEANRDKLLAWEIEGRSYFWMAKEIGLNERNAGAISHWFLQQGIRRKANKGE